MEGDIASSLRRLSENYDSILTSNYNSFPDAKITVTDGREIGVHRGILSARSPFFRSLFSGDETRVELEMKDLAKDFEVSFEALDTVLKCLYSGKLRPLRCVCADGECEHVACRPAVDFVVNVLYASSVFEIPELVNHCQKHLLDILDKIAADDILEVLFVANICGDDLRMVLAYLEYRVALAKHFYPTEAEVAMDVAQVDGTSFKIEDEHLNRIRALSKTVELGKLFFPRCSKVLDDLLDDNELSKLACMENGTEEERLLKKRRYEETRETITKALQEDMRDNDELSVLHNAIVDNDALSEPALMQNGNEEEHQLISDETRDMELQDLGEEFWEDICRVWDA
ncbi:hypothetical protein Vadar_012407 [Vaccinium darrowii]|uniref:Uncharacterized protein n=1 Tax=Vaccinium darrowii TaxID=229202 RepID=A0ACB7YE88_9ERIC|nr:hypothetical protein Vadar_012407 [Vaccinium darrowii]